jgi:hypothetical protein
MAFKRLNSNRTAIIGIGIPIEPDAVISQTHKAVKTYTRYPVEFGRSANDNSVKEPEEVEMEILLTDTPISRGFSGASAFEGRARVALAQLYVWEEFSSPIVLVTSVKSYINMYIESITVNKNTPTNSFKVTIKFIELVDVFKTLGSLSAALLVDSSIAYTATDKVNEGLI